MQKPHPVDNAKQHSWKPQAWSADLTRWRLWLISTNCRPRQAPPAQSPLENWPFLSPHSIWLQLRSAVQSKSNHRSLRIGHAPMHTNRRPPAAAGLAQLLATKTTRANHKPGNTSEVAESNGEEFCTACSMAAQQLLFAPWDWEGAGEWLAYRGHRQKTQVPLKIMEGYQWPFAKVAMLCF